MTWDYDEEQRHQIESTDDYLVRSSCQILKSESHPDHTFVWGPVLIPEEEDHQGDIIDPVEILEAAHGFMIDSQRPGLQHKVMLRKKDVQIVESGIIRGSDLRFGSTVIPEGTWVVGMRVYKDSLRKAISEGKIGGFSIGGLTKRFEMEDRD